MEEFLELIYRNWANKEGKDDDGYFKEWQTMNKATDALYDILNIDVADKIQSGIYDAAEAIQKNAFIYGFTYASKCISHGKVEIGGDMNGE